MTPQEITRNEYNNAIVNEVFAKVFNTSLSAKFQKFLNDFRSGAIQVKNEDMNKLKELLRDYNAKKINQDKFVEKVDIWVEKYS